MKCRLSAACLAIWILLLTGQACAEGRKSILERLYTYATPPEAARTLVEPLNLSKSEGPYSLTVDEILFYGSGLYVSWTARSDSDSLTLFLPGNPRSPTLKLMRESDYDGLGLNDFSALGDTLDGKSISKEYHGLSSVLLPDGGTLEPFDVTVQGFFLKPTVPVTSDSPYRNSVVNGPAWVSSWDLEHLQPYAGDVMDDSGNRSEKPGIEMYLTALPKDSTYVEVVDALMAGLMELGYAQFLEEVDLTLSVNPDAGHIFHTVITGPSKFEFEGCTVEFSKADFSAARYDVEAIIVVKDEAAWLSDLSRLTYELWPDGNKLRMSRSQSENTATIGAPMTVELSYTGNPLFETPSFLLLKAYMEPDSQSSNSSDPVRVPERDITLQLRKVS